MFIGSQKSFRFLSISLRESKVLASWTQTYMKTTITIQGTHCVSCKALIEDAAKEISGLKSCIVDFKTGHTEIEHDETLNWDMFKKEIEALGEYKIIR